MFPSVHAKNNNEVATQKLHTQSKQRYPLTKINEGEETNKTNPSMVSKGARPSRHNFKHLFYLLWRRQK